MGGVKHHRPNKKEDKDMKKFKIQGIFTLYIYAETKEEAIEKFDEISADYVSEPFDKIICEEISP